MIPDLDLARVRKWIDQRNADMPPRARVQIRYEIDVADRMITVLECRPPSRKEWSLYWCDRNPKFHEYDLVPPPHTSMSSSRRSSA